MSRSKTSRRRPPGPAGRAAAWVALCGLPAGPARALSGDEIAASLDLSWFHPQNAVGFAVLMGLVIFATTLAILHLIERRRWTEREAAISAELEDLRGSAERAEVLLGSERQVIATWSGPGGEAALQGDPTVAGEGAGFQRVLAFGTWLAAADASRLEEALGRLRKRGETFLTTLARSRGGFVEAEGRTAGGRALLRLRDVSRERQAVLAAESEAATATARFDQLRGLLDAIGEPVWLRREDGGVSWANRAYCRAVEASGPEAVAARGLELLEQGDRTAASGRRAGGEAFRARVAAIVAGSRRVLDILEVPLEGAAGGIARDVSELETLRADLARQNQAQTRMLDQLPTAVATFDTGQRLLFHNSAYRQLWGLDAAFLDGSPTDGEILDRLRADGKLPEQADYRSWKGRAARSLPGGRPRRGLVAPA